MKFFWLYVNLDNEKKEITEYRTRHEHSENVYPLEAEQCMNICMGQMIPDKNKVSLE
jgi:hypothetical protein